MPMFDNSRRQLNDLMGQRANFLAAAEAAQLAGNSDEFRAQMDHATALNTQIDDLQAVIAEADRYAEANAPIFTPGQTSRRDMAEMGRILAAREPVKLDLREFLPRMNSTTLATGTLVTPVGAGSEVRSGFSSQISSLIDEVSVMDLTGMSAYEEPYVVSEMAAQGGVVATTAGQARTASDPTFAKAPIAPYEVTVTTLVDRNLSRLNPANYAEKIQSMALNALRRKANALIMNGDGQVTPKMFGITTAKNSAGSAIYDGANIGASITVDTLDTIVFSYGAEEAVGGGARLYLTKANLKAIGALRGTNEKRRLYEITADPGNPNTGVIRDGGLIVPYTICKDVGAEQLVYLNPLNYLLGLFGEYTIRVDESVKSIERMNAILGDVMMGGNLVVDKGAYIGALANPTTT